MKKSMLSVLMCLTLLAASIPAHAFFPYELDRTDKTLYGLVVAGQILDGLTTAAHLDRHPDNYIHPRWNWKYGTRRPSPTRMWSVKALELGVVYGVARSVPGKWRKPFMGAVAIGLFACGVSNGLEFKVTF